MSTGEGERRIRILGNFFSAAVAVLAALALWSWGAGVAYLFAFSSERYSTAPSTAVCLGLIGAALALRRTLRARPALTRLALAITGVVGVVGTLACLRPWLGWSLPFETWLTPTADPIGGLPVGQMAPLAGFLLLAATAAYWLLTISSGSRTIRQKLAVSLAAIILLAGAGMVLSYAVGKPWFDGGSVRPMALWTAIAFVFLGGALLADAVRTASDPESVRRTSPGVGAIPVLITVLFAVTISTLTAIYIRHEQNQDREDARQMLATIGDLKLAQITSWREERLNDARFFAQADFVSRDVQMFLEHPASGQARNRLMHWLNLLKGGKRYSIVAVFDTNAMLRLVLPEHTNAHFAVPTALMTEALRSNQVVMSDLHRGDDEGGVHLEIAFPVGAPLSSSNLALPRVTSPPIGVVLLRLDPHQFLYPLLQSWPTPSRTAETLMIRREGNEVVYLNELRHRTNNPLSLRFPIATNSSLPAVKAVLGQSGEIEGRDYRGMQVLTSIRQVPDSTWFLVAKLDRDEIYAPLKQQAWLTLALTVVLTVATGLVLGLVTKRREASEALQRLALTQRVEHLMRNANDAIMLADEQDQILEANVRALELYGYSLAELQAMRLPALRALAARAEYPRLAERLAATGQAVFETLHQRKDGSVFPVEISSSLIEIGGVRYKLGFLRDITQRKAHEREIERLNRLYATLSQVNQSITRVRSREELFAEICRIGVEYGGFKVVWVGGLERATKAVKVLARAGESTGYLDQIRVMADDSPEGHGPVGTSIRESRTCIFNDFLNDELAAPWREAAAAHGLRAVAALPIRAAGEVCGAFTVYAGEPEVFQDKEIALLEEMALDISFALDHLAQEERRRQAEAALRASEDRLDFALQVSETGAWELNLVDHTVHRTLQHDRIFGYATLLPAWTYEMFLEHVLPADRAEVDRRFRQAMAEKADWNFECRIRRCDGETRWIMASGRHRLDEHGVAQAISGVVQDITERKQAELKLQLWAGVFEQAHFGLAIADAITNTFIAVNPTFAHERGYRPDELAGQPVMTVYAPHVRDAVRVRLRDLDQNSHGVFESEHVCKDGRSFPVLMDVTVIKSADGKPATRLAYALDITERKQAQAAIQQSEEFKQSILDSVSSHIAVLDRQGVIVAVNERWRRFAEENPTGSGTPPQNVGLGVNYLEICRQSQGADAAEGKVADDGIRAVLAGQLPSFTMEYACDAPHEARWFSMTVTPLGLGQHSVVVSHLDITDRKRMERALHERLELQNQLAQVAATVPG